MSIFDRRSVAAWVDSTGGGVKTDAAAKSAAPSVPQKYEVLSQLGKGGMGEVLLVRDRDLLRDVAMKLIRSDVASPEAARRFVAEAQATSQLEHPGIPPVYDVGLDADGRCWYSMKLIRGRSLASVVEGLASGDAATAAEYDLHRLVTILERVAEAVHFAHEKGVLHRDLKPENVMLGGYGEVLVVDWGIAKVEGRAETEAPVTTSETLAARATEFGAVKGTIPFMSPEQAFGQALDRRSDVYALGAILYELLTLRPVFEGGDAIAMLLRVARGEFEDVATRDPSRPVHEFLATLCRRAMSKDRDARPATAHEFAGALRSFLDGRAERDRRHREAETLAAQGREAMERLAAARDAIAAAERAAAETEAKFKTWQPREEKRPLAAARRAVFDAKQAVVLAFGETTRLLEGALLVEADNASARAALADLWRERLSDAERRGDPGDTAHALTMVRRYDDGRFAALLAGDGSLVLESDPPGAQVVLLRFLDDDGVLVPDAGRSLGRTPLGPVPLPMGSYLVVLSHPGFPDVRYPVHVTRNRVWSGRVKMRTAQEIGEGFVYVPGGPFVCGEGRDAAVVELPDFAIQAKPTTFADWLAYMVAVEREEGREAADKLNPGTMHDGRFFERAEDGSLRLVELLRDGPRNADFVARLGPDFTMRSAVVGLTWRMAADYCAWMTRASGREWRLPSPQEREKASRGVDGRVYPWGDVEDASLAKARESRQEASQPEPVGAFPTATSVYGMLDAAGNSGNWTDAWSDARQATRLIKGGSWQQPLSLGRCANATRCEPAIATAMTGVRSARSLAP